MSSDDSGKLAANAASVSKPSKLPFWRTVKQAYALWARNFPDLVRTCWLWLLLLAPFIAIDAWWRAPQFAALLTAARTDQSSFDLTPSITAPLLLLITLPVAASIAVAWHRLVLRKEHPGSWLYLRLDSVVVGYMLIFAVIWVPVRSVLLVGRLIGDGTAFLLLGVLSIAFFSLCRDYRWLCQRGPWSEAMSLSTPRGGQPDEIRGDCSGPTWFALFPHMS